MKRLLRHSAQLVYALALASGVASGQEKISNEVTSEVAALRAIVEQLRVEVNTLRKDVLRLTIDRHRDLVRQIKAELDTVRAEQAQLAEHDRARKQDLRDVEELLARKDLGADEQVTMEAARGELAVARVREIEEQSEVARVRERELLHRLETEEQVIRRLGEAWKVSEEKTK
jgi:hypothetical protein